MRGTRIAAEIFNQPWMIERSKLEVIAELGERWLLGERLSEAEVAQRIKKEASAQTEDPNAVRRVGAVSILPVYGVIAPKMNMFMEISGGTSLELLATQFRAALADPEVKAIVLDFDSPGGSVSGVDEMASEIYAARGQKPIVAQVSPMAASAAYYLASQADEIRVMPSGQVGSIGVVMAHRDWSAFEKDQGVKTTFIAAGKLKTAGNSSEPLTDEARAYLQGNINGYYAMFVGAVARGRRLLTADSVVNGMGEGGMVLARAAVAAGMADGIGTLEQTVAQLQQRAARASASFSSPANQPDVARQQAAALAEAVRASLAEAAASAPPVPVLQSSAEAENSTEATVENEKVVAVKSAAEIEKEISGRNVSILNLASRHGMQDKAAAWIEEGRSLGEVQGLILDSKLDKVRPLAAGPRADVRTTGEHATDLARKTPGIRAARFIRALAAKRGDLRAAADHALNVFHDPEVAAALGGATLAGGGAIIAEELSSELIEYLRPYSIVERLNPMHAPMPAGSLTFPKLAGGASASWLGENQDSVATAPSFGAEKLTAKKLMSHVPLSNDLVRYAQAGLAADVIVRDDLSAAVGQAKDLAFIRGGGTAYTPRGIRNWAPSAGVINSSQTNSLASVRSDLGKLRTQLRKNNVRFLRPGFMMSPRTENFLMFLADAQGKPVFYEEMTRRNYDIAGGGPGAENRGSGTGTLLGYPYQVTTQIPENLNTGVGSESELYFVDFADVVIGEVPVIVVDSSQEASYKDSGGTLVSAYSQDQTVIRMINEVDLIARHAESIAVLAQVTWT